MSGTEIASVSSEFEIFAHRPIQTSVLGTVEIVYKPITPVYRNDLDFLIPSDSDTYIDLDRGKLFYCAGKNVDLKNTTVVANNLLHSPFSKCNVTLTASPTRSRASTIIMAPI
jgi:hypothetical protein